MTANRSHNPVQSPGLLDRLFMLLAGTLLFMVPLAMNMDNQFPTSPPAKLPYLIFGVCCLALVWSFGLLAGRDWHRWDALGSALVLFLVYLLIRCRIDPLPNFSWYETAPMLAGILWAIIIAGIVRNRTQTIWLLRITCFAVVLVTIYAISQILEYDLFYAIFYGKPEKTWTHEWLQGWQVYSTFGNPNWLAGYLGPWLLLTPVLFLSAKSHWGKTLILVLSAAVIVVLFRTYARGIWLSMIAGSVVFGICAILQGRRSKGWRIGWKTIAIPALGICILCALISLTSDAAAWFEDFRLGFLLRDNSMRARLLLAVLASNLWIKQPWLGWGTDRFAAYMNGELYGLTSGPYGESIRIFTRKLNTLRYDETHNDFLQALCEWGVVGLALLLLVFAFTAAYGIKAFQREKAENRCDLLVPCLLGAFTTCLMHLGYDFPLRLAGASMILWMLVGLIGGLARGTECTQSTVAKRMIRSSAAVGGIALAVSFMYTAPAWVAAGFHLNHGINNRTAGVEALRIEYTSYAREAFASANDHFDRAAKIQPENGEIYYNWGLSYLFSNGLMDNYLQRAQDRLEKAETTFVTQEFFFHKATVYLARRRFREAIAALERVLSNDSHYPNAHYLMGRAYYVMGGTDGKNSLKAAEEFRKELSENPQHIDALKHLGELQFTNFRDTSGAEITYKQIIEINPLTAIAQERLGYIYAEPGPRYDAEKAREHLVTARQIYRETGQTQDVNRVSTKLDALPSPVFQSASPMQTTDEEP